jgi:general secretion pathway protein K
VLLLVAVMSALAVAVLDDIRFAARRTANLRSLGQAQWYALGAETLAKSRIAGILDRQAGRVTLQGGWNGAPLAFPIEAGAVTLRVVDRGACFNLNSVVMGDPNEPVSDPTGVAEFVELLTGLGVDEGRAVRLAGALSDWIDADQAPNRFGAEDEAYQGRRPGYRTGGVVLAEESELLAVEGFTPEVYARLRPHVCALPQTGLSRINVNTLAVEDAPVLSAVFQGRLPVDSARAVIAARPEEGWPDEAAFLREPGLKAAQADAPLQQLAVTSRYFGLDTDVRFAGAAVATSGLLEVDPAGVVRTVARRWTRAE